jgi:5-methylcytosine-specific restriction enzyme A
MLELKGNVNSDKLFKLLLKNIRKQGHEVNKVYSLKEIASLIPYKTSDIKNYASYNYALTSMFSNQKDRDYFIFSNKSLGDIFTELANDTKRNNRAWNTHYGHEKVKINPKYLVNRKLLLPYSSVESIRILPMSETDSEFTGHSIEDVQDWFMHKLPNRDFNFTRGLDVQNGTLFLFQYKAHVIASAILDQKVVFHKKLDDVYRGAYRFIPTTIAVFNPINSSEMKGIWNDFAGLSRVQHNLDVDKYILLGELLLKKKLKFALNEESEEFYQDAVDRTNLDTSLEVNDVPLDPLGISNGLSQRWIRSNVTSKKAIVLADYKCEYDESHRSFTSRVTGKNYVEAHHLIPLEYQGQFKRSLDVEANIISLCPLCHKAVHHASAEVLEPIIKELYTKRRDRLQKCEIAIDIKKILSYY